MNIALIDGDILVYRVCYGKKDGSWEDVVEALEWNIHNILDRCETRKYFLYLSGSGNFRKILYPLYKANRSGEKPPHYEEAREYLITKWNAQITTDCEADDELSILHTSLPNAILCSIDKDFLQLPGRHFNWVRGTFPEITEEIGMYNFYLQMLVGDAADNIPGINQRGPVRGKNALFGKTAEEREQVVREIYDNNNMDYNLNHKLLWLSRTREYLEQQQEEARQLSISKKLMENQSGEEELDISEDG